MRHSSSATVASGGLLVHGVPSGRKGTRHAAASEEGMPSPRRHGSRSSGLRRGKVRGLVPVRFAGGAAANQAFARVQPANHRVAGLADNVSLRGQGVPRQRLSSVALAGALAEIARLGGGKVESYPEDTTDRRVSASFLYNSHLAMFEKQGFQRVQRLGQNHWVVSKVIAPVPDSV